MYRYLMVHLVLLACLTGCGASVPQYRSMATNQHEDQMANKVTLHIFSGRPNPSWFLTTDQVQHFLQIKDVLPRVSQITAHPTAVLGYSGFEITSVSTPHGKHMFFIYAGNVWEMSSPHQTLAQYHDPSHTIELWLLNDKRSALGENFYQAVYSQIIES